MNTVLIAVMSVDGKMTSPLYQTVEDWSSDADKEYFSSVLAASKLIVMGRKTYQDAKATMDLKKEKFRVVLTRNPEAFSREEIPGKLEFWSETPSDVVKNLEEKGYKELLLVGGGEVHNSFLKAGLVNEIWLTIEPKIFGDGQSLAGSEKLDINMKLLEITKLNEQGTMLAKYEVM